jgi:hypothetical protein
MLLAFIGESMSWSATLGEETPLRDGSKIVILSGGRGGGLFLGAGDDDMS